MSDNRGSYDRGTIPNLGNLRGLPALRLEFDGTFYLGQNSPLNEATWLATYNKPYYTKKGGDISLYPGGPFSAGVPFTSSAVGSVDAITEAAQRADAMIVANAITSNPDDLAAERAQFDKADPMQVGWVNDSSPAMGSVFSDINKITSEWQSGSDVSDAILCLLRGGYADRPAANAVCKAIGLPPRDGIGITASMQGVPNGSSLMKRIYPGFAYTIRDPVFFVDQKTGQLSQTLTAWAYHIGGEEVNIVFPFQSVNAGPAYSFINVCLLVRFDMQAKGILGGLRPNFLRLREKVIAFNAEMEAYAENQSKLHNVPFTTKDLISPVPVIAYDKKWLSVSDFFNPISLCPPTYGDRFVQRILHGDSPIVPAGTPGSIGVEYEGWKSPLAVDPTFYEAVAKDFALALKEWVDADQGRLYPPPVDRTLRLIAQNAVIP